MSQPGNSVRVPSGGRRRVFAFLLLPLLLPAAKAQLAPTVAYMYPPVVVAGQTTSVQMGVCDWTEDTQWFVHDTAIQFRPSADAGDFLLTPPPYWTGTRAATNALPICREVTAEVTVNAEHQRGLVYWQIANASGSSSALRFLVSHEREMLEQRSRDLPQRIGELPVAVSGRLSRLTEVDRYEFQAEHDGFVTVALMARVFGADFRGLLRVFDESGEQVTNFADIEGIDGAVAFAVRQGREYRVELCDIDFRGDASFVYRLSFFPGIRGGICIPAAGKRGTVADYQLIAPGGVAERTMSALQFPAEPDGQRVEVAVAGDLVQLSVSDVPELSAVAGGETQVLPVPGAVTARLRSDAAALTTQFDAAEGEFLRVVAQSTAVAGRADVHLQILDPAGAAIAAVDDSDGTTDARFDFQAKVSGRYSCVVSSAGGFRSESGDVCRLYVERLQPGIELTVPQQITLASGGTTEVRIDAVRTGGFEGAVTVIPEGLPEGVSVDGEWVLAASGKQLKGKLRSSGEAAVTASLLKFRGVYEIDGQQHEALATALPDGLSKTFPVSPQPVPSSLLAVTLPAPFDLLVVDRERQRDVPRGSTGLAELEIRRHEGFNGPVTVIMSAKQSRDRQGIRGATIVAGEGVDRIVYPTFMPEWLATDITRRIVVHGSAEIADPAGIKRIVTRPADARITMIMEGALLKLSLENPEVRVWSGAVVSIPVQVLRAQGFAGAVTVSLQVPDEAAELLRSESVRLDAGTDHGELLIRTTDDSALYGRWNLRIRAASERDGWPVASETELLLDILPASGEPPG